MRLPVLICAMVLSVPAMAQDVCRYYSGDGLSVGIDKDPFGRGRLTIYATDGSATECTIGPGQAETMRAYKCSADFAGDVILVPKEPFGDFAEIIVMPPNILYWSCPVTG